MEAKIVDAILHLDEELDHDQREALRDAMLTHDGVMLATSQDNKPHLMVVGYNPDTISSSNLLEIVKQNGIHAQLVAL